MLGKSPFRWIYACDIENVLIESVLEKTVNLLHSVSDRDLIGEFHSKKLTHKLLFDKSEIGIHE